jgi:glycosyltransferase involved in cell wall biosynthesis
MRPHADLWVVVPCYNEEERIADTLHALAAQTDDDFTLLIVDNGSTDRTWEAIAEYFAATVPCPDPAPALPGQGAVSLITEPQKGTGAAADTGFRYAIAHGARWIARTDADCLPDRHWIARIREAFTVEGLEFVAGHIKPRDDDERLTLLDRLLIPAIVQVSHMIGRVRRHGPQFKYPYFVVAGNNLAVTAAMYERAGGFPRTAIEQAHEDRLLSERIRTLTARGRLKRDMVVYNSTRRLKRYGYRRTLLWYFDHLHVPEEVDVR